MSTVDLSLFLPADGRIPAAAEPAPLRLVLLPGEVVRVPRGRRALRSIAGTAWVTAGGTDIVLAPGDERMLAGCPDGVVVGSLGMQPLLLEVR